MRAIGAVAIFMLFCDSTHCVHVFPNTSAPAVVINVTVSCCHLLAQLHAHLLTTSADSITYDNCVSHTKLCFSYKLIKHFIRQTKPLMDPYNTMPTNGLTTNDTHVTFSFSQPNVDVTSLSIFAFLGRSVATDTDMRNSELWMQYDIEKDKLYFGESACNFNKDVYTTLILASIVLLIFFVAVQVSHDEAEQRKPEPLTVKSAAALAFKLRP